MTNTPQICLLEEFEATFRIEKATSEFLNAPDWTLSMDICDAINSNQQLAKDAVKALKKRLQHKKSKVQLLALTLLETMVKNCVEYVHFQIAERDILQDMIKIVKKKADYQVRDKILVMLDSWQEAFGGAEGKYPQYYMAYDALRRCGVGFPQRSGDSPPLVTPPVTHPTSGTPRPGYGISINSTPRLDEAMASEVENLSLSCLQSMRDVGDLLADMLQAVDTTDRLAVKDEVIVDLVSRCRANQKKLMQMITATVDEELLGQGLNLNDNLQIVLAKHDAISSESALPDPVCHGDSQPTDKETPILQPDDLELSTSSPMPTNFAPVAENKGQDSADEDEEDDFLQLARRHSKAHPPSASSAVGEGGPPSLSNALVIADPPALVRSTKEQDMIDFWSLTLSTDTLPPRTPQTAASLEQNLHQVPASPTVPGNTYHPRAYLGSQVPVMDSYVAPWARPGTGSPLQSLPQLHPLAHNAFQQQPQPQYRMQPQLQPSSQIHQQIQYQPQIELQPQTQFRPQSPAHRQIQHQNQQLLQSSGQPQHQAHHQYSQDVSAYPPPPWAPTPGYYSNAGTSYRHLAPSTSQHTSTPVETMGQMQRLSSFPGGGSNKLAPNADVHDASSPRSSTPTSSLPGRGSNRLALNGDVHVASSPRSSAPTSGQKPFIPSYRLFEDLNVTNTSPSYRLNGARKQN